MTSLLKTTFLSVALAGAFCAQAQNQASQSACAVLIGYPSIEQIDNPQEKAAAQWFKDAYTGGTVIAPGETAKIDATKLNVIWIHIDRCAAGQGNMPAEFADGATVAALKKYVADGGTLLLTKQATQLLDKVGRIDAKFAPNIYSDGDGGKGTDNWNLNAQIGWWNSGNNADNKEADATQYYDHRTHAIYANLLHGEPSGQPWDVYPMEGTGNGTEMWREDHNCMWDLNGFQYTAEGKNTVEKFQNENNCEVLGTWGHVQDYAVAGVIEFKPTTDVKGTIIANGLACCEWSPREGVNAFEGNLKALTDNCISYLKKKGVAAGVNQVFAAAGEDAPAVYYTLQGVRVSADELAAGVYVKVKGSEATKVVVR